jgi:tetratricopeptide (TPR) repeat protein
MPESVKKSFVIFTYFVLILSTLLVFWQVRNFGFVSYDDNDYVYENPHVLNGLTEDGVIWAFTTNRSANWHPLTWLSLMLDCQLFGASPGWMHLMNLILHLANTLLVFAVLKKMTGALWPSAFVAAAFALHPMHVESVAWIAERKDVLSTLFLLLTLAAYVSYVRRRGLVRYVLTVLLFASGLLAKPMLVTLPFLLLLLDYWPLNRFVPQTIKASGRQSHKFAPAPNKRRILYQILIEKIPFFALSVVSSVITLFVQQSSGAVIDFNILPLHSRVANAFLSYAKYIGKMFWPENLAVLYPLDADSFASWQVAMCVLLLLVISIFVIRFGRNQKYLPVGWFWFVGTLVPVIGFVQVGIQALADRYTYISYTGLFIMIAWGLPELLSKWPQRKIALGLSMVIVLTTLGICTHQQVSYWNNSFTLFSHAIEVTQNNYVAYNSCGAVYDRLGRYQDAIEAYKQAICIKPNYAKAHNNLGVAYGRLGRHQEAIDAHKQAIRIKPDYAEAHYSLGVAYGSLGRYQEAIEAYKQAILIKPDYAEAHYGFGVAYGSLGRYQEAIEAYKQAILIKPDYAEAHYGLGVAYGSLGRYQEAIEAFKQAILIKPGYAEAHYGLGVAYGKLGRYQDAVEAYKQAIRIKPDYAEAHYGLGVAYGKLGRYQDAVEAYKQAIRIKPDYADAHYNLGAAYDSLGRYQDAIESYKQAIRIKPDDADAHYNLGVTYLITGDKGSALEEYKILKTLDAEKANKLLNLINK